MKQESSAIRGLNVGLILSIGLWVLGYYAFKFFKMLWTLWVLFSLTIGG